MEDPDKLAHWLEQEAKVKAALAGGAGPGVARPEQVAGLTGLQFLQAMLSGRVPFASIAQTLDFALIEVEQGRAVFQGVP